ncbi:MULTISPECIES: potassium channel family protein [unclassified Paraburkholderia]|uniref:potassium channel family protein n=1 Tax=unclassified Paraburkholderia TaxID=2615204 RepID=UPI002AB68E0E|nr:MULTISPECIES: potassium channel family protein [unclassified Paraburkholderia]
MEAGVLELADSVALAAKTIRTFCVVLSPIGKFKARGDSARYRYRDWNDREWQWRDLGRVCDALRAPGTVQLPDEANERAFTMNSNGEQRSDVSIRASLATSEFLKVIWHLRSIVLGLTGQILVMSVLMFYVGRPIDVATRTPASMGETLYFCAVTALTIGYGDVIPTTSLGRLIAVLLGMLGIVITGVTTAAAVYAIQTAARKAHL